MNYLRSILLVLLGLSYLISGYMKLLPIEYFENDILKSGLAGEYSVLFMSRLIIGSEFVLGIFFLFRLYLKPALKLSLWMLLVYSVYLTYIIIRFGNEGNCGCYGRSFVMTPLEGILKNILIAAVTVFLLKTWNFSAHRRVIKIIAVTVGLLTLFSPFVLYKIDFPEKTIIDGKEKIKVDLDALYTTADIPPPPFELRKGKAIVAFLSLTCSHCKLAANKLELIKKQNPDLPIYFILNGEDEDFAVFKELSELEMTPYAFFNDGDEMLKIAGYNLPTVFLVNDSYMDAKLDYPGLTAENLRNWLENS